MNSKVTILIPCYNGEKTISKMIDSILEQTYKNIELIIVDDGSKDKTKEVIDKYKNEINLVYIFQENGGQASAVNNGLKYVTGDYFITADADDFFEVNGIEVLAKFLDANPNYNLVRGNVRTLNEEFKELEVKKPLTNKENLFYDYLVVSKNVVCFPGVLMMRFEEFKKRNSGLDIYIGKEGQNWQLLLPVLYYNKCKNIDNVIYNYIISDNSHSHKVMDKKKKIDRCNGMRDIVVSTIKKLDMFILQKIYYISFVRLRYLLFKIKVIIFD